MEKTEVRDVVEAEATHDENHYIPKDYAGIGGEKDPVGLIAQSQHHLEKSPLEKCLLRKLDTVILPLAALAYFASYLDRNSIGNAKIMGFATDLSMTDGQFYDCLTMFFVGYIIMLLPANILNRKLKPNRIVGLGVVFFGSMLSGMSAANNYATVLALRILIGCGASFVPALTIYTSLYYKRDELATRSCKWIAIIYVSATLSGAFGGVIAYGIQSNLTYEATGRHPWQWLFLIEGLLGIVIGTVIFILLPRYADDLQKRGKKHWLLTKDEIAFAATRSATYNTRGAKVQYSQLWATVRDPKTYFFAMCQSASVLGTSVVGSFLPTFIVQFGFSPLHSQLFTIIPYATGCASILCFGFLSDRLNRKAPFLLIGFCVGCLGYIILLSTTDKVAAVIATCLITAGCYTCIFLLPVWIAINSAGFTKRGATWAFSETCGLCFSVMGTRIYTNPPRFAKGHSIVLAFNVVACIGTLLNALWMRRENKKKDRIEREYAERNQLHPHIVDNATLEDVQDQHISFRYII